MSGRVVTVLYGVISQGGYYRSNASFAFRMYLTPTPVRHGLRDLYVRGPSQSIQTAVKVILKADSGRPYFIHLPVSSKSNRSVRSIKKLFENRMLRRMQGRKRAEEE